MRVTPLWWITWPCVLVTLNQLLPQHGSSCGHPKWQISRQQMRGTQHLQKTQLPWQWSSIVLQWFAPSSNSVRQWFNQCTCELICRLCMCVSAGERVYVCGYLCLRAHFIFPHLIFVWWDGVKSLWFCQQLQHLVLQLQAVCIMYIQHVLYVFMEADLIRVTLGGQCCSSRGHSMILKTKLLMISRWSMQSN